jgi:hypothetical protein
VLGIVSRALSAHISRRRGSCSTARISPVPSRQCFAASRRGARSHGATVGIFDDPQLRATTLEP